MKPIGMRLLLLSAICFSQAITAFALSKEEAVKEVNALAAKIEGFRANLVIKDNAGGIECISTSTISVSKELGFKTDMSREGVQCEITSDYKTGFQYHPEQKQAMKITADRPELVELFRKPATDMNPLLLLDQESLKFQGEETLNGETVYHFRGTTETQYMPDTEPVKRELEAWISKADGFPRKTIEIVSGMQVETTYNDVQINPAFKPSDFQFVPSADVKVIDQNALFKQSQQQSRPQSGAQRPGKKPEAK